MREQKVIVTKVEKLLALYDQMEEQNQTHTEQLMQAILKEVLSHNSTFQTTATTLVDAGA